MRSMRKRNSKSMKELQQQKEHELKQLSFIFYGDDENDRVSDEDLDCCEILNSLLNSSVSSSHSRCKCVKTWWLSYH